MMSPSYKKALISALALHFCLVLLLLTDSSSKRPVLTEEAKNSPGMELPLASVAKSEPEIVKAVSVDNKEVMETVNRLKQEREQQKQAELNRQKELNRQFEQAKQQRLQEQKQLAKLKEEANRIAIARKKQAEEEKKHLKELAEQKLREAKRIEELKKEKEQLVKQQALEAKKLAELNKKKAEEQAKIEEKTKAEQLEKAKKLAEAKAKADQAKAEQAKADLERKQQQEAAAKQQAAANAEKQARIAGEVDKYKALIVNAISRHWILPDNVDSTLSSQFRIRLAPDGAVLEVSLTRGSGDALLDRSAQTAIYKASPLPVPSDSETFNMFRDISLTVRPEQLRG